MASDVSWLWCIISHSRLVAFTRAESDTAVMALFWRYKYFTREGMVGMTVRPRPSQYMATGKEGGQSHSSGHPPVVSACREPNLWLWGPYSQAKGSCPWEQESGSRADKRKTITTRMVTVIQIFTVIKRDKQRDKSITFKIENELIHKSTKIFF